MGDGEWVLEPGLSAGKRLGALWKEVGLPSPVGSSGRLREGGREGTPPRARPPGGPRTSSVSAVPQPDVAWGAGAVRRARSGHTSHPRGPEMNLLRQKQKKQPGRLVCSWC